MASIHPDFNPPGEPSKLTARKSTLTTLFVDALTPYVKPSHDEVEAALRVLGMSAGHVRCAYCGGPKSEWDHFRAIVRNRRPTGYVTEIANLVPTCGKCNQSKGARPWREWIESTAEKSPTSRKVSDLAERIRRLEEFEKWKTPTHIDFCALLGKDEFEAHWGYLEIVEKTLQVAELNAARLRRKAVESIQRAAMSTSADSYAKQTT